MEARTLLATFTVNSTVDAVDANPGGGTALTANGQITLRSAIQEANAHAGGDTIVLPAGTYTLTIPGTGENGATKGDLNITGDLTITGAGAGTTIVDGGKIDRVFQIMPNVQVSISGVTVQNGETPNATLSPGISSDGGGVDNEGNLTLTDCVVQNCVAGALLVNGQPSENAFGGGISNGDSQSTSGSETLVLDHTVVSGNKASGGGGIENYAGTVTILDSTIDGNAVTAIGGGISTGGIGIGGPFVGASVSLVRSTVSNNSSFNQGAGVNLGTGALNLIDSTVSGNKGAGVFTTFHSNAATNIDSSTITGNVGGISAGAAINLANSIVAGNTAFDVDGLVTSQGYNLMQNSAAATISGVTTGNILGKDAKLGPLADNGGPTKTHLLLAGSPAIDAANPAGPTDPNGNPLSVDQRGLSRKVGPASDIGSVEDQATAPLLATTTAIASSANPSTLGQSVTFTATVTTTTGIPVGTVNFLDAATVIGTGALGSNGIATFATTILAVGSHPVTAAYLGDATHQPSTSSPLNQIVNAPSTGPVTDLALSGTAPGSVTLGQNVTYTLAVANGGTSVATGVKLADTLPAGASFVSASGGVVPVNGVLTFNIGSLATNGAAVTETIVVRPTAAGMLTNTATVTGDQADTTPADNSLLQKTTVDPSEAFADLSLQGGAPRAVALGSNVTYTLTIINEGPATATGVKVTDILPAGVTFVSATGGVTPIGGVLTFSIGSLAAGAPAVTETIIVTATEAGDLTSTASVMANTTDPTLANNSLTQVTHVNAPPPPTSGDGPIVLSLKRFGIHWQPTVVVLAFNEALAPNRAQDTRNYLIVGPGGRAIGVDSALYDPTTRTVTLRPHGRLNIHFAYRLTVVGTGPHGVTDVFNRLLDGAHTGTPASDYDAVVDLTVLVWFGPHPLGALAGPPTRFRRPYR